MDKYLDMESLPAWYRYIIVIAEIQKAYSDKSYLLYRH